MVYRHKFCQKGNKRGQFGQNWSIFGENGQNWVILDHFGGKNDSINQNFVKLVKKYYL